MIRFIIASINKAIRGNQKTITFINNSIKHLRILDLIAYYGYIQSYEIRGHVIIVRLKTTYFKSTATTDQALQKVEIPKRIKNASAISIKK